jgi:hypothetical protein
VADNPKTDRANAQFKKLQRLEDGKKAMSEHETQQAAIRAKTARLRALRLAHEAANPTPPPVPKPVKKKVAKKTGSSATLATWLADQEKGGHRR